MGIVSIQLSTEECEMFLKMGGVRAKEPVRFDEVSSTILLDPDGKIGEMLAAHPELLARLESQRQTQNHSCLDGRRFLEPCQGLSLKQIIEFSLSIRSDGTLGGPVLINNDERPREEDQAVLLICMAVICKFCEARDVDGELARLARAICENGVDEFREAMSSVEMVKQS